MVEESPPHLDSDIHQNQRDKKEGGNCARSSITDIAYAQTVHKVQTLKCQFRCWPWKARSSEPSAAAPGSSLRIRSRRSATDCGTRRMKCSSMSQQIKTKQNKTEQIPQLVNLQVNCPSFKTPNLRINNTADISGRQIRHVIGSNRQLSRPVSNSESRRLSFPVSESNLSCKSCLYVVKVKMLCFLNHYLHGQFGRK